MRGEIDEHCVSLLCLIAYDGSIVVEFLSNNALSTEMSVTTLLRYHIGAKHKRQGE